jgi:Prion-inhibition and propagation
MISFEYFKFESWTQQSGLLTTDTSGNPSFTDDSIRLCLQRASSWTAGPLDIDRVESNILKILGRLNQVLNDLDALKKKYRIDVGDDVQTVGMEGPESSLQDEKAAKTSVSRVLPQSHSVMKAIQKTAQSRQKQSSRVSFFRKVSFGWALTDDTSDREKIAGLIKELQYWNNALREMLPAHERKFGDTVVSVRTLALSNDADRLADIGNAAHKVEGQLYNDIYTACTIKAKRVRMPPASSSMSTPKSIELTIERIAKIKELSQCSKDPHRQLTAYFSGISYAITISYHILIELCSTI